MPTAVIDCREATHPSLALPFINKFSRMAKVDGQWTQSTMAWSAGLRIIQGLTRVQEAVGSKYSDMAS